MSARFKLKPAMLPVGAVIIAMICFQTGAAIAKQLFPLVGAPGTAALRLSIASIMLMLVWRVWHARPTRRELRIIGSYGVVLGLMNCFFYLSLTRIPLGIAVALEFTGPLAVALAATRRAADFVWVGLAVLGLLGLLPLSHTSQPLTPSGIAYAMAAAVCWGLYIVIGRRAGGMHTGRFVALGMLVGACIIVPVGAAQAGRALISSAVLPSACAVAILSSAIPYTLELYAMTRIPARTFGIMMSLDPAFAALAGILFLGERLTPLQWAAIASIIVASAGSASTGIRAPAAVQ